MREHLARAALSGARAIFLEVDPDNAAAVALYRRFGFRDVGRREGYYRRSEGQVGGGDRHAQGPRVSGRREPLLLSPQACGARVMAGFRAPPPR